MAKFKLKQDYKEHKKGDEFEPVQSTTKVLTRDINGKQYIIPRVYCQEVVTASINVGMEDEEAAELARRMGVGVEPGSVPEPPPEPPPAPEPLKPGEKGYEEQFKLKKGQFLLSTMTNGRLPDTGIDHVMEAHPDSDWDKDALHDIPAIDHDHVWDPNLAESMWLAYKHNKKMLITGFPATGKTTSVRQLCAWVRHPIMRFNGKDGIEASSFLGNIWATNKSMEWKDGMLPQGCKRGYMVTIDEMMKIPPGVMMSLQGLFEEDGVLVLDDKPGTHADKTVVPHENFRMFNTDNAKGVGDNFDKFGTTQIQDTSTLDRFQVTATLDYLEAQDEINMLNKKYPHISKKILKQMVTFAGLVRTGYATNELSLTLSPRGLQTACEFMADIPDVKRLMQMVYIDKLGEQDEIDGVNKMLNTVWR